MVNRAIAWLAICLLAGCATAAQRQGQAIATNSQDAGQKLQSCMLAVSNSADFDPIRPHGLANVNEATLEQLSDASFATDDEIKAILVTHPKFQLCRTNFLNQIAQTTPTVVPIMAATWMRQEDALVGVIQKKISWGGYLTQVRGVFAEGRAQVAEETRRVAAGLEQSHQAEMARRQAAANAMMQYSQTQQIINNMNKPVFTNCTGYGYSVNCISQ